MAGLIDPQDLKSIVVKGWLKNVNAPKKDPGHEVDIIEIEEKGLTLDASDRICSKGHHVLVKVNTENAQRNLTFTSTARVSSIEPQTPGRARIGLSLMQFEASAWNDLLMLLSARQREIQEFIHVVRGQ